VHLERSSYSLFLRDVPLLAGIPEVVPLRSTGAVGVRTRFTLFRFEGIVRGAVKRRDVVEEAIRMGQYGNVPEPRG
jgi:hypothetical protein